MQSNVPVTERRGKVNPCSKNNRRLNFCFLISVTVVWSPRSRNTFLASRILFYAAENWKRGPDHSAIFLWGRKPSYWRRLVCPTNATSVSPHGSSVFCPAAVRFSAAVKRVKKIKNQTILTSFEKPRYLRIYTHTRVYLLLFSDGLNAATRAADNGMTGGRSNESARNKLINLKKNHKITRRNVFFTLHVSPT